MKKMIHQFTAAAAILSATVGFISEAKASKLSLDGAGHYLLGNTSRYYGRGTAQSGRYVNLGQDYYHKITYGIDHITNSSFTTSGTMSFEFWALPYYSANSGIVLMTRGLDSLRGGQSVTNISRNGLGVSLNARRFPEINLWELTQSGWNFRDSLSFTQKNLL